MPPSPHGRKVVAVARCCSSEVPITVVCDIRGSAAIAVAAITVQERRTGYEFEFRARTITRIGGRERNIHHPTVSITTGRRDVYVPIARDSDAPRHLN